MKNKIIKILLLTLLILFAWSPWVNRDSLYARVTDQYRDTGPGCDYQVMWAPFGRWVVNCERGHYVFLGILLF